MTASSRPSKSAPLDVERFAAAAAAFLVGIAECEAALQLFLDVIHLGAEDEHDRLRIDQDRHALVFDDFVELALLIGIFERVAEARATARAHADAHSCRWLAALGQQRLDALRRSVSHQQGLLSRHHPFSTRETHTIAANRTCRYYVGAPPGPVSRVAAAASASAAKSTSAFVVKRPKPIRIDTFANASERPNARST